MSRLAPIVVIFTLTAAAYGETLTWQDCVREAQTNNPRISEAREALRRSQAQFYGSLSPFLPAVTAGASASRSKDSLRSYGLDLSARQNLFAGGGDLADVNSARSGTTAAQADLDAALASVGYDLRSSFSRLLYAEQQLDLSQDIALRRKENVRLVGLRYDAGREHKGSYLRSRAAWRQADFEVAQAKRALRVAERSLNVVLGRSLFTVIKATGTLSADQPQATPDVEALAVNTPAYRRQLAQHRSAKAALAKARSAFYPDISASASTGRRGNDWPPQTDHWSAGLSASLPLFSGGRDYFTVKSADAGLGSAQAALKETLNEELLTLEDAFAAYQDAFERTQVQDDFLEAAKVRSEIARGQYTSGLLSFEDWDLIENDLIANQKSWLAARREAVIAQAAWLKAQGEGPLQ
ncbi:MAG: TolC family protein [Elusimicrobiota bacterium]